MPHKLQTNSKSQLSFFFYNLDTKANPLLYKHIVTWLDNCKMDGLSPVTCHEYSDKISRFYYWWTAHTGYSDTVGQQISCIHTSHIREFAAYLRETSAHRWGVAVPAHNQTLSPATVAGYGRTVKVFFNWLEQEEFIERSPINKSVRFINKSQKDTTIKSVSEDAIRRIFAVLNAPEQISTFAGVRDLAMISLLLDSGVRRGELLSMEVADLDIKGMRFKITGKTGTRTAFFSEKCKGVLLDYLTLRNQMEFEETFLWVTVEGLRMGDNSFGSLVRRLQIRSGVDFHIHQLRHTFATMLSSKVSSFELQQLMGHSSISTTMIYVKHNPDSLARAHTFNSPLQTMPNIVPRPKGRPRRHSY